MARTLRLEYEGACYHVINRGNYRRGIFASEGAAEAFERALKETAERFGWRIHAYVIMSNHFHLAVETPKPNLSAGMKYLQGTWANRFNRYRGENGRPFQGRYKSLHVEPGHALAQVAHYIHLNPVRARITPMEQLAAFRWSSLWWSPRKNRPAWLEVETLLREAGGLNDGPAGWRSYRTYLSLLAEEDPRQRQGKFGDLSRGWVVGTKEFRRDMAKELKLRGVDLELPTRAGNEGAAAELLHEDWTDRLEKAAKAGRIDLQNLGPLKSAGDKVVLAAALKRTTGVSNGWLSENLKMGTPASVSQFVRRFLLAGGEEDPRFKRILSTFKT
jgi:REP element-mobilizing transposase RayT